MEIGEVTSPSARDKDLLPDAVGVVEHGRATASLAGLYGAHEARPARANDHNVEIESHSASFNWNRGRRQMGNKNGPGMPRPEMS